MSNFADKLLNKLKHNLTDILCFEDIILLWFSENIKSKKYIINILERLDESLEIYSKWTRNKKINKKTVESLFDKFYQEYPGTISYDSVANYELCETRCWLIQYMLLCCNHLNNDTKRIKNCEKLFFQEYNSKVQSEINKYYLKYTLLFRYIKCNKAKDKISDELYELIKSKKDIDYKNYYYDQILPFDLSFSLKYSVKNESFYSNFQKSMQVP